MVTVRQWRSNVNVRRRIRSPESESLGRIAVKPRAGSIMAPSLRGTPLAPPGELV
jgi:hypothetical protein